MPKLKLLLAAMALLCAGSVGAQQHNHQHSAGPVPASFQASSSKPFAALMDDAMSIMDRDMQFAAMNGEAGHDFLAMMIPHHQGAVDMAKAVLLYTQDPAMRNLAQGIITEQQNEIRLMQAWLEQHKKGKQ